MGEQLLLLRPRRFGKSLWLSTLENYYAIDRADQFDALFGDLAIGRKPTERRNSISSCAGIFPRWPRPDPPSRCAATIMIDPPE